MADEWVIYVRDSAGNRIGQVDRFSLFTCESHFNDVGKWQLTLPYQTAVQQLNWKGGIILSRNGVPVFSGPINQRQTTWSTSGYNVVVGGKDDMVNLATNLVLPVPSGPPYTSAAFDQRSGLCETVLKSYVSYNIGPAARLDRQVSGLTIEADSKLGSTVTGQGRFQFLLPFLADLALAGGDLGFRLSNLLFQVYKPTDKTSSVIFSTELGNITNYTLTETAATENYVYAGGTGVGTARTFYERGDPVSQMTYGRFEHFIDDRSTTDLNVLAQEINSELLNNSQRWSATLTPVDLAQMKAIDNYGLGDKVTCNLNGAVYTGIIRQLQFRIDPQHAIVTPVVGTPTVATLDIFGKIFSMYQVATNTLNSLAAV